MILKALSINNFRCFEKMEIEFNENCTVLVGMNGSGKSTILEAAAISVGTLIAAMDVANYSLKSDDAHFKYYDMGSVIDVQPQYPVSIRAIGNIDNNEVNWERSLSKPTGRGSLANAKNLTSIAASYQERLRNGDAALILPLIAYYGTGRLWAQHREKKNISLQLCKPPYIPIYSYFSDTVVSSFSETISSLVYYWQLRLNCLYTH